MQCVTRIAHSPFFLMPLALIILFGTFAVVGFILYRKKVIKTALHFLIFSMVYAPFFLVQGFALLVTIVFIVEPWDDNRASIYFPLHAAIKNTCILDPKQVNCPHTVEELKYIEPEYFNSLLEGKEVKYQYTNNQNYTLIIKEKSGHVVIFDPRMKTVPSNYNGADFMETNISACRNDRKLDNPIPFRGLWDEL